MKNVLDGFEDRDYGPILSEVKATGFINLSRYLRTPKTVLKIKNIGKSNNKNENPRKNHLKIPLSISP